jgi:hypothetical protein
VGGRVKTIFYLCDPRGDILHGNIRKTDFAPDLAASHSQIRSRPISSRNSIFRKHMSNTRVEEPAVQRMCTVERDRSRGRRHFSAWVFFRRRQNAFANRTCASSERDGRRRQHGGCSLGFICASIREPSIGVTAVGLTAGTKWVYTFTRKRWTVLAALGRCDRAMIPIFADRLCKLKPLATDAVKLIRGWRRAGLVARATGDTDTDTPG